MTNNTIVISKIADLCVAWRNLARDLYSLDTDIAREFARTYEACAQDLTDLISAHYDAQTEPPTKGE